MKVVRFLKLTLKDQTCIDMNGCGMHYEETKYERSSIII